MKVHIMSFLFTQFGSIDYSEQEIDRCIGILKVELQMKVREDVTITEKAPTAFKFSLSTPPGEGHRSLVHDCEIFTNLRLKLYLKVNGMKLDHGRLRQNPGVVLYPIYCLINSDCVSNTNYIKTEASLELQAPTYIPH